MTGYELGDMIKKRRKSLNIKQQDLSEITGVSMHTLSNIETGKGNPTFQAVNQILDVLGLDFSIIIKGI